MSFTGGCDGSGGSVLASGRLSGTTITVDPASMTGGGSSGSSTSSGSSSTVSSSRMTGSTGVLRMCCCTVTRCPSMDAMTDFIVAS